MSLSMQQRQTILLEGNYATLSTKNTSLQIFLDRCSVFVSNSKLSPLRNDPRVFSLKIFDLSLIRHNRIAFGDKMTLWFTFCL